MRGIRGRHRGAVKHREKGVAMVLGEKRKEGRLEVGGGTDKGAHQSGKKERVNGYLFRMDIRWAAVVGLDCAGLAARSTSLFFCSELFYFIFLFYFLSFHFGSKVIQTTL
jgi:hypothetical protein